MNDLSYTLAGPITIEGGYTTNCVARTVNPENTVIDIGQGHLLSLIQEAGSPEAQINMDGLTLKNTNKRILLTSGNYNLVEANDPYAPTSSVTAGALSRLNLKTVPKAAVPAAPAGFERGNGYSCHRRERLAYLRRPIAVIGQT